MIHQDVESPVLLVLVSSRKRWVWLTQVSALARTIASVKSVEGLTWLTRRISILYTAFWSWQSRCFVLKAGICWKLCPCRHSPSLTWLTGSPHYICRHFPPIILPGRTRQLMQRMQPMPRICGCKTNPFQGFNGFDKLRLLVPTPINLLSKAKTSVIERRWLVLRWYFQRYKFPLE